MRIEVGGLDVGLGAVVRGKVVRRVLLALSRFGPRLRKVTVFLSEPANPLGGVDQRCRMRAWLRGSDGIHAEAIDGGIEAAVARAAAQLAKRVSIALDGGAGEGGDGSLPAGDRVTHSPAPPRAAGRPLRRPAPGPRRRTRPR